MVTRTHMCTHRLGSRKDRSRGWPYILRSKPQVSTSAQRPRQGSRQRLWHGDHVERLVHSAGASEDFTPSLYPR